MSTTSYFVVFSNSKVGIDFNKVIYFEIIGNNLNIYMVEEQMVCIKDITDISNFFQRIHSGNF
ncbi:MAG TPA: hypothetical protein DDY71_11130 [Spirochaetia bacterium]|nr:hypothetical protein [Spirochaetia bacterium]